MDLCLGPQGSSFTLDGYSGLLCAFSIFLLFSPSLLPSLFLTLILFLLIANICPRTQRLGFPYLRTNTHTQIYRHVLRVCLLISVCISRCLALIVPKSYRRTPPGIRSVTPLANSNFGKSKIFRCCDYFIAHYRSIIFILLISGI